MRIHPHDAPGGWREVLPLMAGVLALVAPLVACGLTSSPLQARAQQVPASREQTVSPVVAQAKYEINPKDGLMYAWIPPGTFRMGCSPGDSECQKDEKPVHSVTITNGFWIGRTPVTQEAYKKVIGDNPSHFPGDELPVETVSWNDAVAYCDAMGMRLPTEAEWEYAARGGTTTALYAPLVHIAWYEANSMGTTHDVGQKQANAYGLNDMLGNVWEWVADWYGRYDAAAAVDPKGPPIEQVRVLRGGSWFDDASGVRVSLRNRVVPGRRFNFVGFRCAGN